MRISRHLKRPRKAALLGVAVATGALLALVMAVLAGCGSTSVPTTASPAGGTNNSTPATSADSAPDFSGTTLAGLDVSLGAYRGKPLVLAFMASW